VKPIAFAIGFLYLEESIFARYSARYYVQNKVQLMPTTPIYAEQTVSITDLRKSPAHYFKNEPVAVLSNNRTAGYIVPADVYQHMVNMIEQAYPEGRSRFRPSRARLDTIVAQGAELLGSTAPTELGGFSE
jgi:antitoxin YafN